MTMKTLKLVAAVLGGAAVLYAAVLMTRGANTCSAQTATSLTRVVTADTDPRQIMLGTTPVSWPASNTLALAQGPFVWTDAIGSTFSNDQITVYTMPNSANCGTSSGGGGVPAGGTLLALVPDSTLAFHGMRWSIPSGQTLCATPSIPTQGVTMTWTGYQLY
jgi:hypothetical protein